MINIFPEELMISDKVYEVIEFLKKLDVQPRLRKEALISWCKHMGLKMKREWVKELLGDNLYRAE